MTRKMYDSTEPAAIPLDAPLVMGYVDGSSAWTASDWARFVGKTLVRICIFNDRMDAQVIDIEPGNNDAQGAVPWIRAKWARDEIPTVYCFSDRGPKGYTISEVRAACDAAGVKRPLFLITDFDNRPDLFDPNGDPEIIGKQYANAALLGGHYDASVVADFWPGVDVSDGGAVMDFKALAAWLATPEGAAAVRAAIGEPTEGYGTRLQSELVNDIQLPMLALIDKLSKGEIVEQVEIDALKAKLTAIGAAAVQP